MHCKFVAHKRRHLSHIILEFPSPLLTPPPSISHSQLQQITNHSQTLNMIPFTLTDTHFLPTLQLLQQPNCHRHQRLGLLNFEHRIEN
jgi:hypothetical protein